MVLSAHKFYTRHYSPFKDAVKYKPVLEAMQQMYSKTDVLTNKTVNEFREHKYNIKLSMGAMEYLLQYLKVCIADFIGASHKPWNAKVEDDNQKSGTAESFFSWFKLLNFVCFQHEDNVLMMQLFNQHIDINGESTESWWSVCRLDGQSVELMVSL